jgi:hypothetical protein
MSAAPDLPRSAHQNHRSGAPPLPVITRWQPYVNPARTMRGFLAATMPSGMTPKGAPWLAMPSIRRLDREGNPVLDELRGARAVSGERNSRVQGDRTREESIHQPCQGDKGQCRLI